MSNKVMHITTPVSSKIFFKQNNTWEELKGVNEIKVYPSVKKEVKLKGTDLLAIFKKKKRSKHLTSYSKMAEHRY